MIVTDLDAIPNDCRCYIDGYVVTTVGAVRASTPQDTRELDERELRCRCGDNVATRDSVHHEDEGAGPRMAMEFLEIASG